MNRKLIRKSGDTGQALVEFALLIVVVLMLMFMILEAGRVLWAWVTVQSAARDGARYAITGRDGCEPRYDRLECVITTTYRALSTLPLNHDPDALFESDNYFLIQVYGVDENGQLLLDYAGAPGQPVVVRAIYRVPIITPFFRPIRESLPVFGQVTMNNEQWGNLGGATAGVGLPPPLPDVPTPGVTPSPTATPTAGASPTPTATATTTASPTPTRCATEFDRLLVQDDEIVGVTGELGSGVSLFDMSVTGTPGQPLLIGSAHLIDRDGHACPGYADASVGPPLVGGHTILVRNDDPGDGSFDTAIVLTRPPTATPTHTNTPAPSPTITLTPTPAPTSTPQGPFLTLFPSCGFGPEVNITVQGFQFPNGSVNLFWRRVGQPLGFQGTANGPQFTQTWRFNVTDGTYQARAIIGGTDVGVNFVVPCPNVTATPPAATPTSTPIPPDLLISGPVLISTPPIVEYRPVEFEFIIANQGEVDVETQFFTDAYIDPPPGEVGEGVIDLAFSDGYQASSSLPAGATRVIVVRSPMGFTGGLQGTRTVYGMVDSLQQVVEGNEVNNLTHALGVAVTPAPSPTPSPTPAGTDTISGQVRAWIVDWAPQRRAQVWLVDATTSAIVAGPVYSAADGRYAISGVPPGTYNVIGCIQADNQTYAATRPGVTTPPGFPFADLFLGSAPVGCPVGPN